MLLDGSGAKKNIDLAIEFMKEAAFRGHLESQKELGNRFFSELKSKNLIPMPILSFH